MSETIGEQSSALRMATFRLARRLRAQKSDDTMSDPQFGALAALHVHGPHTLTALAEREKVSAPSMNRTVNCLEETGYITRETDSVDKRKISVAITESGTAVVSDTVRKRDAWLSAELETLSADERDVLARAAEIMAVIATR